MTGINAIDDIEARYQHFRETLTKSAQQVLPEVEITARQKWMTAQILQRMEQRRLAKGNASYIVSEICSLRQIANFASCTSPELSVGQLLSSFGSPFLTLPAHLIPLTYALVYQGAWGRSATVIHCNGALECLYNLLDREIRQDCRKAKETMLTKQCQVIEQLDAAHKSNLMHSQIKLVTCRKRSNNTTTCIEDKNGDIIMEKDEILSRWSEYIGELYNDDNRGDMPDIAAEVESPITRR